MCNCTNSTEVKPKALCLNSHKYLHFTITMNRTGHCHKNGVHNHGKEEKGAQHYRVYCCQILGRSSVLFKYDYQQVFTGYMCY